MKDQIIQLVEAKIESDGIDINQAALSIGIGASALARHLAGEYIRSDSAAKYRLWLNGESKAFKSTSTAVDSAGTFSASANVQTEHTLKLDSTKNVVDLFCGCGGMSLGFERFGGGGSFRIAMALDIEEPMVKVFNDNHPSSGDLGVARQADISDFLSEGEIQAYYLDHLCRSSGNLDLGTRLNTIGLGGVRGLRERLRTLDSDFLAKLTEIRREPNYINALKAVGNSALGQTSVCGFHNATKLPMPNGPSPKLGPLIWHFDGKLEEPYVSSNYQPDEALLKACKVRARNLWKSEIGKLSQRTTGAGRGQLASAADRIQRFKTFLETPPMVRVRKLWIDWRAERESIRISFFDNESVQNSLRSIYHDGHQVSVLLGGPPCQGFSRIGRGKIRSLREQSLHVHEDENSVDSRNQLMHQYVLFVAALAPEVFLFENVKHFQAVVRSDGAEFDATDILADAIEAVSERGVGYRVASKIIVASQHAVPQARERFVMVGVRQDLAATAAEADPAEFCLALTPRNVVPLGVALEGLPPPEFDSQSKARVRRTTDRKVPRQGGATTGEQIYRDWTFVGNDIDAHIARQPRRDDAAFFSLMGPGKRWMDYRADNSNTLSKIQSLLSSFRNALEQDSELARRLGVDPEDVVEISKVTDGSLPLRLLLECIPPQPGELQHHLLSENYLKKREGAHGDWLSRMDASVPSKTIVSHMAKDTYAYVHPYLARTLSVREAARVQSFPDDYRFGAVGLVDGFKVVGNAVPPLLSRQFAERVASLLVNSETSLAANN